MTQKLLQPVQPEMTREQIRDLVKECGIDWHRGFMPLFDGDDTNRYEVLVRAALAAAPATDERLLNLLARIHGDGGHYVDEHGLDKACVDADLRVAEMHAAPAAVPPGFALVPIEPDTAQRDEMRDRLAAQPAEPVAWLYRDRPAGGSWELMLIHDDGSKPPNAIDCYPLYTAPPASVPVPLTLAERAMLHDAAHIINRAARTKGDHWDCVGSLLTRLADDGIAGDKP